MDMTLRILIGVAVPRGSVRAASAAQLARGIVSTVVLAF
jgi:hypothetical protein